MAAFRYGPLSYFRLGHTFPRDRLRQPYGREPLVSRYGGIFIPAPDPVFRRLVCAPPPARYEAADSYVIQVQSADQRPARTESGECRPARRDECR